MALPWPVTTSQPLCVCVRAVVHVRDIFFFSCTCAPLSYERPTSLAHSGFRAAIKSPPLRAVHGQKPSAPAAFCGRAWLARPPVRRVWQASRGHVCAARTSCPRLEKALASLPRVEWKANQSLNCLPLIFFCCSESTKGTGSTYLSTLSWCQRACLHLELSRAAVCQTASNFFFCLKGSGQLGATCRVDFEVQSHSFHFFLKESLSFEYKMNCSAALITIHFLACAVFLLLDVQS